MITWEYPPIMVGGLSVHYKELGLVFSKIFKVLAIHHRDIIAVIYELLKLLMIIIAILIIIYFIYNYLSNN